MKKEKLYTVYALQCPITNEVRYVGHTSNLEQRVATHYSQKSNPLKFQWLQDLKSQGLTVKVLKLYKDTNRKTAMGREQHFITKFDKGNLFNRFGTTEYFDSKYI